MTEYFSYLIYTLAVSALLVHLFQWIKIMPHFLDAIQKQGHDVERVTAAELVKFSNSVITFSPALESEITGFKSEFLRSCANMYVAGVVRGYDLMSNLKKKIQSEYDSELSAAKSLVKVNRYVPILTWAAVLTGVFWMFFEQGNTLSVEDKLRWVIGSSIAVSIYGVAFGYFVVEPTIDYLYDKAKMNRKTNLMVIDGFGLVLKDKTAFEVLELVNCYLDNEDTLKWPDVFGKYVNPNTPLRSVDEEVVV